MLRQSARNIIRIVGNLHGVLHSAICGAHPSVYPWHFQWHALTNLNRDLGELLPTLSGRVLDLGCGRKPYRQLFHSATTYTGCDIIDAPGVDVVIRPGEALPFPDSSFDVVFSTQVFEHVANLQQTIAEIRRVLAPGGQVVVSVPFIFQVHGLPHDYRRLSEFGIAQALDGFHITTVRREGAIGGTLATLFLGWIDTQLDANIVLWCLKIVFMPVWILLAFCTNALGFALDFIDTTDVFYNNILAIAQKK